jgi:hypothetical protein
MRRLGRAHERVVTTQWEDPEFFFNGGGVGNVQKHFAPTLAEYIGSGPAALSSAGDGNMRYSQGISFPLFVLVFCRRFPP